jgi:hypothetical protein
MAQRPIEPFDEGILVRLARPNIPKHDPRSGRQPAGPDSFPVLPFSSEACFRETVENVRNM